MVSQNNEFNVRKQKPNRSDHILKNLYLLADLLNRCIVEQEVVEGSLKLLMEISGIPSGSIALWEQDSGFRVVAADSLFPSSLEAPGIPEEDCLWLAKINSGDLNPDMRILECTRLYKSEKTADPCFYACVPLWDRLLSETRPLGLIRLASLKQRVLSKEVQEVLQCAADQIGVALVRTRLHEHLEKEVRERTDALNAEITERRQAEEEFRLLQTLTLAIGESKDLSSALALILRKVCEATSWVLGQAWTPSPDATRLECSPAWYSNVCALEKFRRLSEGFTFPPGIGLPGSAWYLKRPIWMRDVAESTNFPRVKVAMEVGIKAGLAIPICAGEEVVAVIEFFMLETREEDERFERLISAVAAQLGLVIRRKEAEEMMYHMAYHDLLTDLPNRLMLHISVDKAITAARHGNSTFALLIIDLDRFRDINDTLGHHNGDLILQQIGPRLQNVLKETDTIAHLSGDEFALILPRVDAGTALQAAQVIIERLQEPFLLEEIPININASIGIALFPAHGEDYHALMMRADIALHKAKRGEGDICLYSPKDDQYSPDRLRLMGELRKGIEEDQLFLLYQPKIELKTFKSIGVEALVRWQHPKRGVMPPNEFIALAEHTGMIKELTFWVIKEALRQSKNWYQRGLEVCVSVNISVKNLQAIQFLDQVRGLLSTYSARSSSMRFEITESIIMEDPNHSIEIIRELNAMGIRFSIDDFGTGYSSLGYLQRLPVDEIKIDKSFTINMMTDESSMKIVRSIIELGHSLGLKVTAEGVENKEILDRLISLGCDIAQGYLISKPIPHMELKAWLYKSALDLKNDFTQSQPWPVSSGRC